MWEDIDSPLKLVVQQMGDESRKELIQTALSCDISSKSTFIKKFLSSISNLSMLESMLLDKFKEPTSDYKITRKCYLQARIDTLKQTQNVLLNA
ncbi:MAG: hypothetical protein WC627_12485 [Legionella sp.]|jgi:hypothetical protein